MNNERLLNLLNKKKAEKNRSQLKFVTPKKGTTHYVLLPGWNPLDRETFWHDYGEHWCKDMTKVSPKGTPSIAARVICNAKTHGTACPICNALREALDTCETDEQKKFLTSNFGSSKRFLMNVLALDSEEPDEPQILSIGTKAFDQLIELVAKWSTQMFDPNNAQKFSITRTGEGFDTNYIVSIDPSTYPLKDNVLTKLHDLDAICEPTDQAQLTKALQTFRPYGVSVPALSAPASAPKAALSAPTTNVTPPVEEVVETKEVAKPTDTIGVGTDLDSLLKGINAEVVEEDDIPF